MVSVYALLANLLGQAAEAEKSDDLTVYIMLGGGFLIIAVVMLRNLRRRVARSEEHDRLSVGQRVAQTKPARDVHDKIGELMAELADLSRGINGQLDTRMARLEILLAQADETIEKLSGDGTQEPMAPQRGGREKKPALAGQGMRLTAMEQKIVDMANKGAEVRQISKDTGRPAGEIELILALKQRRDVD
jgi:hypothetical protein